MTLLNSVKLVRSIPATIHIADVEVRRIFDAIIENVRNMSLDLENLALREQAVDPIYPNPPDGNIDVMSPPVPALGWPTTTPVEPTGTVIGGGDGVGITAVTAENLGAGAGIFCQVIGGSHMTFYSLDGSEGIVIDAGAAENTARLSITSLAVDATPDVDADYVATYDADAVANKSVLLKNLHTWPINSGAGTAVGTTDGSSETAEGTTFTAAGTTALSLQMCTRVSYNTTSHKLQAYYRTLNFDAKEHMYSVTAEAAGVLVDQAVEES